MSPLNPACLQSPSKANVCILPLNSAALYVILYMKANDAYDKEIRRYLLTIIIPSQLLS